MNEGKHSVKFLDSGREPECRADPRFPLGRAIDAAQGADRSCIVELLYPAPRCGVLVVECERCGRKDMLTVAGRADDPRAIRVACLAPLPAFVN